MKNKRALLICFLLAVVTLATYWPVLNSGFINLDDPLYVTGNPWVLSGLRWRNIEWAFSTGYVSNWHPLTWISHQVDVQLFGQEPRGHHLTSLLLHTANTVLLFCLLQRMTRAPWRSAFVAALFGLHPLHVESVAWVSERKDVLSTFFFMLTIWAYGKYVERRGERQERVEERGQRSGVRDQKFDRGKTCHLPASIFYVLCLLLFALGLMSKPMLVTVPFVLLLLDHWPLGRIRFETKGSSLKNFFPLLWEKIPFFVLSTFSCFITFMAQAEGHSVAAGMRLEPRLANAIASYLDYLGKTFWPTNLTIFYPHPLTVSQDFGFGEVKVLLGGFLVIVLSCCAIFRFRREPWFATGWFWYLGTLVPVIGVVQVGGQAMADRYTYIPLIGIFIVVVWTVTNLLERRSDDVPLLLRIRSAVNGFGQRTVLPGAVGVAVVFACVACTRNQLEYWKTDFALFTHAVAASEFNPVAYCNLGDHYAKEGKYDQAAYYFGKASEQATMIFFLEAHLGLAAALEMQGKHDEAIAQFHAALKRDPRNLSGHLGLANALRSQGKLAEAIPEYQAALHLNPTNSAALNDLAWIRAAAPDATLRNGPEAVRLGELACQMTHFREPQLLGTLAAAYAEAGRFDEAVKTAQQAKQLATATGRNALAQMNEELLGFYRAREPYHEPARRERRPE